jgi:hypothetical protein
LNGIVEGGKCNACHGYPPVKSLTNAYGTAGRTGNYSTAKLQNYSGGGGVHDVAGHLALTTKASDGWNNVNGVGCTTCHYGVNTGNTHNLYGNFSTHHVQVVIDPNFKFDSRRPITYTSQKAAVTATKGTCTNVACHFQKSPRWSTTTYTNR